MQRKIVREVLRSGQRKKESDEITDCQESEKRIEHTEDPDT